VNDLGHAAIRGGAAKAVAQLANFAIRLGSLMVLARLLSPAEFGLVAMVNAVAGVFTLMRDAGLSIATVQSKSISHEQVSTLFWINTGLGLAMSAAFFGLAPVLVAFYGEPRLYWITVAVGSGFILNAAGVQHSALLQRQMRFATLAAIETVALVVSTAVGVIMAVRGFGHRALVAITLSAPAITSICAWLAGGWIPGRPRRHTGLAPMLRFGGAVTLNTLVVYVAYNLDKVLLGRFGGANVLGVYGRAYQLVNIPTENLNAAVGGVAISALSRIHDDPARYRSYFLKGYATVLSTTVPVTVACVIFAADIVRVALGVRWADAAPLLRLLAPTILVFALINPLSWLMLSSNLASRSLRMALVIAPLVVASYAIGLPYGAVGVATGFSTMMVLLALPLTLWAIHGTVVTAWDLLRAAGPALLSGVVATVACLAAAPWLSLVPNPVARLMLGATLLLSVYAGVLLFGLDQKGFYLEMVRRLLQRPVQEQASVVHEGRVGA
jgi:O-antigen/teichoic acid export membrane protein